MSNDSRLADKFVVRLPDGIRDQIATQAKRGHQSMNAWICQAVEEKLARDKPKSTFNVEETMQLAMSAMDQLMTDANIRVDGVSTRLSLLKAFTEAGVI